MAAKNLDLALRMKADLDAARRDLDKLTGDIGEVGDESKKTDRQFGQLGKTIKSVALASGLAFSAREVFQSVDSYTALQNRLRLVTESQAELAKATEDVFNISQDASAVMSSTANIYQRFAKNSDALGLSQARVARLTESVAKSVATVSDSAESSNAALTQFGQGLGSGVLRGEEFNSVMENAPALADALATGLGVTTGELRNMANEGKLTGEVVVNALEAAQDSIDEAFATRVKTISQSFVELSNSADVLFGKLGNESGATSTIAEGISSLASGVAALSENTEVLGGVMEAVLIVAAGRAVASLKALIATRLADAATLRVSTAATLATAKAEQAATSARLIHLQTVQKQTATLSALTAATTANAAATTRLAAASTAATLASSASARVFSLVKGLLGGPLGITVTLGLAALAFKDFGDAAEEGAETAASAMEKASLRIREATRQMVNTKLPAGLAESSLDEIDAAIESIKGKLEGTKKLQVLVQAEVDFEEGTSFQPDTIVYLDIITEQVRTLQGALARLQAERSGSRFKGARDAKAFLTELEQQAEKLKNLSTSEQALAVLRKNNVDPVSDLGKAILEQAAANEKAVLANEAATAAERAARSAAEAHKNELKQAAKSQLTYVTGLERQVAILGLSAQQVQAYELAEKKLTGALLARAQAAQAAIAADEQKQQSDADAATLSGIRAQLLRGQGDESGALAIELGQQFAEITQRLQAVGDTEGEALIDRLINVKQASARMSELQAELDRLFADQSRTEQSIQTQVDAGSISELSARQQIVDLHAATATEVERLLPLMQELAAVTGDPAALARVKDLQAELGRMRVVVDETTQAIQRGFEDGLSNALEGLATRTLTIREAVQGMARDIASSLARLAAQKIANSVATSIFGGGDQGAELTKGAAAVTASSLALGTASASLIPGALAIETAAISLAAAAAAAAAVGGSGGGGDSDVSEGIGLITAVAGLFSGSGGTVAAAGGGQVLGPGTPTSDSIPALLSTTEYVTRGAVVTQPGALPFLHDFNARGMAALNDYALRVRHSTGGLAGAPAPSMPAPSGRLAQPAAALAAPQVTNNQRFMLIDDPDRIADGMRGSQGEDVVFLHLSRNPGKVKQILGGG